MYLVMVDFLSGKPFVKCLGGSASSEKVVEQLQKWFEEYGFAARMRCDGGPEFCGRTFLDWAEARGIVISRSSAYNPKSNTRSENSVCIVKQMLKKLGVCSERALSGVISE